MACEILFDSVSILGMQGADLWRLPALTRSPIMYSRLVHGGMTHHGPPGRFQRPFRRRKPKPGIISPSYPAAVISVYPDMARLLHLSIYFCFVDCMKPILFFCASPRPCWTS